MGFLIGLLTVVMVLDCAILIFLVLIQLPKKEAGAGLAFGGAATDVLFGAGSGNVLTKVTKYAAGAFFVLAILLSVLQRVHSSRTTSAFQEGLAKPSPAATMPATTPQAPTAPPATPPAPGAKPAAVPGTNVLQVLPPSGAGTNLPLAIPVTPATPAPTNK
jgi:preprotein translocase subunit SecG